MAVICPAVFIPAVLSASVASNTSVRIISDKKKGK